MISFLFKKQLILMENHKIVNKNIEVVIKLEFLKIKTWFCDKDVSSVNLISKTHDFIKMINLFSKTHDFIKMINSSRFAHPHQPAEGNCSCRLDIKFRFKAAIANSNVISSVQIVVAMAFQQGVTKAMNVNNAGTLLDH